MKIDLKDKQYHFIGAGGIGMSGLAKVLLKNGAKISGSDQSEGFVINRLNKLGADIRTGHIREWIERLGDDVEAVVISAAVSEDNPELKYARQKGFRVLKYAEMLGALMDRYNGIAIAGTHGKSSTSGWAAYILDRLNMEPNYIIGADIGQLEGSSGVGEGDLFVAEACEYDRSFLKLRPRIAAVLNIEEDHLDYYKNIDDIIGAFSEFLSGVKQGGIIVTNADDANFATLGLAYQSRLSTFGRKAEKWVTFGINNTADYMAQNLKLIDGCYSFELCYGGYPVGRIKLSIPGKHNVYNCLAAAAVTSCAGVATEKIIEVCGSYTGADRRLMVKAEINGIKVLDDYAHHPTEIRASLKAIRERYPNSRIICVFQPHQYSRTRFLLKDFAESFKLADITIVPEIYFVRDTTQAKQEVNSGILVERIKEAGSDAMFIDGFGKICDYLKEAANSGDVVVTMGAGDIWKVADEYIQWLR